jgi:hypothetical protein
MAIRMSMAWPGISPAQYDRVLEQANWEREVPAGALFHVASFKDGVLQVTDAWETAAHFEAFVASRLMPAIAAVGIEADPPEPTIEEMHEFLVADVATPSPVLEEVFFPGVTAAAWDALAAEVGWAETTPVGGRAHLSVVRPDGVSVYNVWRSIEDHEAFETDRVVPAMLRLGADLPPAPEQSFRPVHRYFVPSEVSVS